MIHKFWVSAGHGGKDSGAVFGDITEAKIANSIASKLVQLFVKGKKKVKFVGKNAATADTIGQMRRERFSLDDLLIDIHANAAAAESASGVEVWIAEEKMRPTAERIAASIAEKLGMRNRGVKKDTDNRHGSLGILRTGCPAVLIELGFLTNAEDREKMITRQAEFAEAIFEAVFEDNGKILLKPMTEKEKKAIHAVMAVNSAAWIVLENFPELQKKLAEVNKFLRLVSEKS